MFKIIVFNFFCLVVINLIGDFMLFFGKVGIVVVVVVVGIEILVVSGFKINFDM